MADVAAATSQHAYIIMFVNGRYRNFELDL